MDDEPQIDRAHRALLRTLCDHLIDDVGTVADIAVTKALAATPAVRLDGPVFTDASVRKHNEDPVRLFLMMAGDMAREVSGDEALELRHNAQTWATAGMRAGVITSHQVARFSTAAHAACLRLIIGGLPDYTLPSLMGALGEWHSRFYRQGHELVEALLRTAPGFRLQREGDNWRNWLLETALVDAGGCVALGKEAPERVGIVAVRADPVAVREVLAGSARPDWWWTVYQSADDLLIVVVDTVAGPEDWLGTTVDCLTSVSEPHAAAVARQCHRDDLVATVRLTSDLAAAEPFLPLRARHVVSGPRLDVVTALWRSEDTRHRLIALVHDLDAAGTGWRQTVATVLRCDLNLAKAASALGVHRSTLTYRLDRVTAETGVDPRTVEGAAVWWGALTVNSVRPPGHRG